MDIEKPVSLNPKALNEFKAIFQEEFGRDISDDEAQEMGSRLLRLFLLLREKSLVRPFD